MQPTPTVCTTGGPCLQLIDLFVPYRAHATLVYVEVANDQHADQNIPSVWPGRQPDDEEAGNAGPFGSARGHL